MKESNKFQLLCDPVHAYNWVPFGHMHFGVFLIDGSKLNKFMIDSDAIRAFRIMKQIRFKNPFKILSDRAAILIYFAEKFNPLLVDYIRCTRIRKCRFSAHIVLYDPTNKIEFFREGIDNQTIHYYYKMQEAIEKGLEMGEKCDPQ